MTDERPARRYPASAFPEIQGIRLRPPGADATLVNLSATGVLVECASRSLPGTLLTVAFTGTFSPALIECRVVRSEVVGIASDGSMRFHLGLAFSTRIALPNETENGDDTPAAAPSAPPVADPAAAALAEPVLRNRW